MNKRTKALDIPKRVKDAVWQRDNHRCILCGSTQAMPNAHIISRAQGGRGIETNIVTLCQNCHRMLDQSIHRKYLMQEVYAYMQAKYPGWQAHDQVYRKGEAYVK